VTEELRWLAVVRHGQSTGNIAAQAAEEGDAEVIDIPQRDADVPLSDTGREQAATLGTYLAGLVGDRRPDIAVISPYLRARQTAEIALADLPIERCVDERLRDRELGILDLLTARGVAARLPDEARRKARLGKFYYRPPGGESWTDVLLRLRSLLADLRAAQPDGRVILFAHDAIVLMIRYLVEHLDEAELMDIGHRVTIANCSVSTWRRSAGMLIPESFNDVVHLRADAAPVTKQEAVNAEPS
jgi:probable phosphoglycerate mutase